MHFSCPHCGQVLEFSGKRPSFCGYCGQSISPPPLGSTAAYDASAATRPPMTSCDIPCASDAAEEVPEVIGGYRLVRSLGAGGMGTVYEAEETTSGRRVALKLLAPHVAAAPEAVERFRQEGRLASMIAHPRCVFVLAADED